MSTGDVAKPSRSSALAWFAGAEAAMSASSMDSRSGAFLGISPDVICMGTATGTSTRSSHTQTFVRRVSSSGPWSGDLRASTTFHAWPFITASCFANILSLKSISFWNTLFNANDVCIHHAVDVSRGRK